MDVASDLRNAPPAAARRLIRAGTWNRPTSGICLGYMQANLAIFPGEAAGEFEEFCRANPRPMPLVDVTEPGDPTPRKVAPGADLRTDVPRYRVYRKGKAAGDQVDILDAWQPDMVAFLLGCSFTAELGLLRAGVRLRHIELGRNVAMFMTSIQCTPAGRFRGPMVVSMRPIARDQLAVAERVTARLPVAHGAPVHVGDPHEIGIADLMRPDFGDPIEPLPDEVPAFWACGVTPQAAIMATGPELAITHAPGHMFITDVPEQELAGS